MGHILRVFHELLFAQETCKLLALEFRQVVRQSWCKGAVTSHREAMGSQQRPLQGEATEPIREVWRGILHMDKGRIIPENSIPGNRYKRRGTTWRLEELQVVGHAHSPDQKSESYEMQIRKGQQGYVMKGLLAHWDFIFQITWRLVK